MRQARRSSWSIWAKAITNTTPSTTLSQEKKAFIVRGIIRQTDGEAINTIEEAFSALSISEDVNVGRFTTAYQRHHPDAKRAPLYRVLVPAASDDETILGIRTIGYCGVKVEKIKKSTEV